MIPHCSYRKCFDESLIVCFLADVLLQTAALAGTYGAISPMLLPWFSTSHNRYRDVCKTKFGFSAQDWLAYKDASGCLQEGRDLL